MKKSSIKKSLPKLTKIMTVFLLILILPINILVQIHIRHQSQEESSMEIFGQLEQLVESNRKDIEQGKEEFSEKAIQSAEMAAYFVKYHPSVTSNLEQSKALADKLDVDEIHFFTSDGEIYAGTHPQYYGYTFQSGEQMMYFLPMLEDKSLQLCQEITPNTAEGKEMQYAAVWMEDGSGIVQIGMEPHRLLHEIKEKSLTKIIASLPFDLRGYLHVIDKNTGQLLASTASDLVGLDLSANTEALTENSTVNAFHASYNGERYCIYLHAYSDYIFVRSYLSKYPLYDVVVSSILVLSYIGISVVAVLWIIVWYINKKLVHNLTILGDNLRKIEN